MPLSRSLVWPTVCSSDRFRAAYDENSIVSELIYIAFNLRELIRYNIEALEELYNTRVHRW